ncbi:diguanylate cyclase [Sphingomonas sp. Tas61C01]|uniref:diguanylate cyclase n=1 Tax=Sphingomonas sp. Tas61C01 TaxID=3458297 RepID=UPI00403E8D0C
MNERRPRLRLLLECLVYFGVATLTIATTRFGGGVAFIWIATALLIGRLSSMPYTRWWPTMIGCGCASMIATGLFGLGPVAAPALAMINIGEAALAAALVRRSRIPDTPFQSLGWMFNFIVAVGVVAPLVSAILGASVADLSVGADWRESLFRWYAGHALGNLTFTPIATLILRGDLMKRRSAISRRLAVEAVLLLSLVIVASIFVFSQSAMPLLFLPILPIILVTFRLGRLGAAASIVILAAIGGGYTSAGSGPISLMHVDLGTQLQFFQFYLASSVLTVLPVATDLARRSQLYRALRDSEARYRVLAENSTDIILNIDLDGKIRFVSPSIRQLGGYDPADLVGKNAALLVAPEHRASVHEAHLRTIAAAGEPVGVEYLAVTRSGDLRWFETHTRAIVAEDGEVDGVVSIVRDIAGRKALEARLTIDAATDPLTGLLNRRAFVALLDRQGGVEGCLAIFDIDHFKRVNDRWGHAAGDQVLRSFAEVARRTVRGADHVGRLGGEEFAILLPGASMEQAEIVCERLRRALAETVTIHEQAAIQVTVSGGVAPLIGSPTRVLEEADAALYRAKFGGRDRLELAGAPQARFALAS